MEDNKGQLGFVAIIGGGKMGEAILSGLINVVGFDLQNLAVAEPSEERCEFLSKQYGVQCFTDGRDIMHPTTVILAVKPQVLREVAMGLAKAADFDPARVVTIAAGITTQTVSECFPDCLAVRVMPNLALSVSAGMSVVAGAKGVPAQEVELVRDMFASMGEALIIPEEQIDVAMSVSGSGPAFFALLAEELAAAAVQNGLSPEISAILARQTLIGAGLYLDKNGVQPQELRHSVTSPNGTTQAAIESFVAQDFASIVQTAFKACIQRAKELA